MCILRVKARRCGAPCAMVVGLSLGTPKGRPQSSPLAVGARHYASPLLAWQEHAAFAFQLLNREVSYELEFWALSRWTCAAHGESRVPVLVHLRRSVGRSFIRSFRAGHRAARCASPRMTQGALAQNGRGSNTGRLITISREAVGPCDFPGPGTDCHVVASRTLGLQGSYLCVNEGRAVRFAMPSSPPSS